MLFICTNAGDWENLLFSYLVSGICHCSCTGVVIWDHIYVIHFVQHYISSHQETMTLPFPVLPLISSSALISISALSPALLLLPVVIFIPVSDVFGRCCTCSTSCLPLHLIALLPYSSSLLNLLAHQLLHSFILTSPLHLSVLRDPTPVRGCLQKLQLFFSVGLRTKGHIFFCCVSLILLALSICRWCAFFTSNGVCSLLFIQWPQKGALDI